MTATKPAKPELTPLERAIAALQAPTPREETKQRPGKGSSGPLTYVDARYVMDRLDAAVGPFGWNDRYVVNEDGSVECTITIHFEGDGGEAVSSKADVGVPSKIEPAKGAYSDAFKRAAVKWGIGRDLYDEDSEVRQPAVPHRVEQASQAEQAVVGHTGLTTPQRNLLFAKLKEAGIKSETTEDKAQRKEMIHTVTGKWSVTEMTGADLDLLLAFLDGAEAVNE